MAGDHAQRTMGCEKYRIECRGLKPTLPPSIPLPSFPAQLTAQLKGPHFAGIIKTARMKFDIVTIFPGFFAGFFEHGIVRRAQAEGLVDIAVHDLRAFTHDRHRTVDDRPFGGGEGMVLKPEPLADALESLGIPPKEERSNAEEGS